MLSCNQGFQPRRPSKCLTRERNNMSKGRTLEHNNKVQYEKDKTFTVEGTTSYRVNLQEFSCTCMNYLQSGYSCKHCYAAGLYYAKKKKLNISSNPLIFVNAFREWNFIDSIQSTQEEEIPTQVRNKTKKKSKRVIESLSQMTSSAFDCVECVFGLRINSSNKGYQLLVHQQGSYIENSSWISIDTKLSEFSRLREFLESVMKCTNKLKKEEAIQIGWQIMCIEHMRIQEDNFLVTFCNGISAKINSSHVMQIHEFVRQFNEQYFTKNRQIN
jgi:hypothetical protein